MPYPFDESPYEEYLPALRKLRREELIAYKFLCSKNLSNESKAEWAKKFNSLKGGVKSLIEKYQVEPRENNIYLGEIELALEKLNQEFSKPEKPDECPHAEQKIRLRRYANNTTHVASQCLICGRVINDHKKSETPGWELLPPFEEGKRRKEEVLYSRWWELRHEVLKRVIGEDGSYPRFDYEAFKLSFESVNPKPLSPSECIHDSTRITLRKYSETNTSAVLQCSVCGKHVKNIPKKEVGEISTLPWFELNLEEEAWDKYFSWSKVLSKQVKESKNKFEEELLRKIQSGEVSIVNKTTFGSYYESNEWNITRNRILSRDDYICQACGKKAECVHHITYDRLGKENDLDLVSLCEPCHLEVHVFQDNKWYGYRLTPVEIRDLKQKVE